MDPPSRLLFLPGASGNMAFWKPVATRLRHGGEQVFLGWPGFGPTPADPAVNGWTDLLVLVLAQLDRPCALIAQSMGGVLALQAALARPERITHLVLAASSGRHTPPSAALPRWRPAFRAAHPRVPDWFASTSVDLSARLPSISISIPTLLLWGDADPISPGGVGQRLASLLPDSRLIVLSGGSHDLALEEADQIAPLIDGHLSTAP